MSQSRVNVLPVSCLQQRSLINPAGPILSQPPWSHPQRCGSDWKWTNLSRNIERPKQEYKIFWKKINFGYRGKCILNNCSNVDIIAYIIITNISGLSPNQTLTKGQAWNVYMSVLTHRIWLFQYTGDNNITKHTTWTWTSTRHRQTDCRCHSSLPGIIIWL